MKSKFEKRKKLFALNKKLRIFIIITSVIVMVSMSVNLYSTITKHDFTDKKSPLYSYNTRADVEYTVALKPSVYDLFGGQKSLGKGNTYVNAFVDEIDPSFTYEFSGERPAQINGSYQVYAVAEGSIASDKNSKTIWQKKITIQDEKSFNSADKKISIKANNPIKLDNYKQIIDKMLKGISTQFNIKFTVYWDVQLTAKTDKGIIRERLCPSMEIPLYSNTFEINGQLSQKKNGAIETTQKIPVPINKSMLILSTALIIIFAAVLIFLLIFTSNSLQDDPLKKKIKNIFKQHGDRLVALRSDTIIADQVRINVVDINDLIRIADEIGKPVLYIHDEDINQITRFYVMDEAVIYLYNVRLS